MIKRLHNRQTIQLKDYIKKKDIMMRLYDKKNK